MGGRWLPPGAAEPKDTEDRYTGKDKKKVARQREKDQRDQREKQKSEKERRSSTTLLPPLHTTMDYPPYLERQPVGIENSGNTCYCNAVLQVLFSASKFCTWFLEADSKRLHPNPKSRFKGQLCVSWVRVLRQAYAHYPEGRVPRSLNCSQLLSLLCSEYPQFAFNRQNDAHEFLRNFLDGLSSECNRVVKPRPREDLDDRPGENVEESSERFWQASMGEEQSVVTDMFAGQQATRITCGTCMSVRHRFDSFLDVSVEFDANSTSGVLTDMLTKSFLKNVEYKELDCPFCKRRCEAEVRQLVWRLPAEYLVIHVKRFRWNTSAGTLSRINNFLKLPEDGVLNMGELSLYSSHPSTKNAAFVLEGIVSQSGTVDSGHYTATAAVNDRWYYFSDDATSAVTHLPSGSSIYILLFKRAQPCVSFTKENNSLHCMKPLDAVASRRPRAHSLARQDSATSLRAQHAWESLTEFARRNISPSRRLRQGPSESSFSSSSSFREHQACAHRRRLSHAPGLAQCKPLEKNEPQERLLTGAANRPTSKLESSLSAGSGLLAYRGLTNILEVDDTQRRRNTSYTTYHHALIQNIPVPCTATSAASTAALRTFTPAVTTRSLQRKESSDLSLDFSLLRLEKQKTTVSGTGGAARRRSPSNQFFRRRAPSSIPSAASRLLPPLDHDRYMTGPTYVHNYRNPGLMATSGNPAASRRSLASSGSEGSGSTGSGSRFHSVRHPPSVGTSRLRQPTPIQPMPVRRPVVQHVGMEGSRFANQDGSGRNHRAAPSRHEESRQRPFYRTGRSPSPRHFN
ncbi:hypothetical protein ACSSS7_004953 [Eimeria intestinalis]